MLRDTMMSTIPGALMATDVLGTDRFHRLRAVRKFPSESTWKAIQIAMSASTMPTRRVSIPVDATADRHAPPRRVSLSPDAPAARHVRPGGGVMVVGDASSGVSTVVIGPPAVFRRWTR